MREDIHLDRPIVILGAARSGTTLLADTLLSRHPGVAYWSEPNYIWRSGHAYRSDDLLAASDATPAVRRFIRGRFESFLRREGGSRFMEKTPSNCLRMPFVLEVLPDARVVHVIRDGRDVAHSAAKEWSGTGIPRDEPGRAPTPRGLPMAWRIIRNEARMRDRTADLRSVLELPAYGGRLVDIIRRQVFRRSEVIWGPRIPGLRRIRKRLTLLQTCAVQWDVCVRMARSACLELPEDRYHEIRYEDLVTRPRDVVGSVLRFLELDLDPRPFEEMASKVRPPRQTWEHSLTPAESTEIEAVVGSSLRDLGYPLRSGAPFQGQPG